MLKKEYEPTSRLTEIFLHISGILQATTTMDKTDKVENEIAILFLKQLKRIAIYFISNISDCCLHKKKCLKNEIGFWTAF